MPKGYQAVTIIIDRVWIFEWINNIFYIADIQYFQGFTPIGTPIVSKFNKTGSRTHLLKGI